MKVDRGGKSAPSTGSATSGSQPLSGASGRVRDLTAPTFADALAGLERARAASEMEELAARIDAQAAMLVKRRTITELERYRELVTEFLRRVVASAWKVEEIPSAHFLQNNKVFIRARQVEEKLVALAERIREGNAEALAVTAATSEIRGLLFDLQW